MAILMKNTSGVMQAGRGLPPFSGGHSASTQLAVAVSKTTPAALGCDSEGQDDDDGDGDGDDDDDDNQTGEEPIAN